MEDVCWAIWGIIIIWTVTYAKEEQTVFGQTAMSRHVSNSLTEKIKLTVSLRFICHCYLLGYTILDFFLFWQKSPHLQKSPTQHITKEPYSSTTVVHADFSCYLCVKALPKTHLSEIKTSWPSFSGVKNNQTSLWCAFAMQGTS